MGKSSQIKIKNLRVKRLTETDPAQIKKKLTSSGLLRKILLESKNLRQAAYWERSCLNQKSYVEPLSEVDLAQIKDLRRAASWGRSSLNIKKLTLSGLQRKIQLESKNLRRAASWGRSSLTLAECRSSWGRPAGRERRGCSGWRRYCPRPRRWPTRAGCSSRYSCPAAEKHLLTDRYCPRPRRWPTRAGCSSWYSCPKAEKHLIPLTNSMYRYQSESEWFRILVESAGKKTTKQCWGYLTF